MEPNLQSLSNNEANLESKRSKQNPRRIESDSKFYIFYLIDKLFDIKNKGFSQNLINNQTLIHFNQ